MFTFIADTLDGKILPCPTAFNLRCEWAKPLGCDIVRQFNKSQCIVAKKVFLIYYAGQVFGSTQFTGVAQFVAYMNNACRIFCTPAYFTIDNCKLELNGCDLQFYTNCPEKSLNINGCGLTLWGCQLNLD